MSFDAVSFFQNYGIEYRLEGHKHCRPGWVQTSCPFCVGNPGYHLGYEFAHDWWNCWRCGYHRTWDVVLALLNGNRKEAKQAMLRFKGRETMRRRKQKVHAKELELPPGLQPLTKRARNYLIGRRFDPDLLEFVWKIQSTGTIGRMKYSIFIPIYLNNRMVSWQCRDITGQSSMRYLAQSEDKELLNNKDTLYGIDQATGSSCVIVEGVTDVWRLGPGAVATFGIKYRPAQVTMLLRNFDQFHILFDPADPQAQQQAGHLGMDLACLGGKVKVWRPETDLDPGDFGQDDADAFMRDVLGRGSGY